MTEAIKTCLAHWREPSSVVFVPHNDDGYRRLADLLDELVDEVGNDEPHPLAFLMDLLCLHQPLPTAAIDFPTIPAEIHTRLYCFQLGSPK